MASVDRRFSRSADHPFGRSGRVVARFFGGVIDQERQHRAAGEDRAVEERKRGEAEERPRAEDDQRSPLKEQGPADGEPKIRIRRRQRRFSRGAALEKGAPVGAGIAGRGGRSITSGSGGSIASASAGRSMFTQKNGAGGPGRLRRNGGEELPD